jgi:hypothetical protein
MRAPVADGTALHRCWTGRPRLPSVAAAVAVAVVVAAAVVVVVVVLEAVVLGAAAAVVAVAVVAAAAGVQRVVEAATAQARLQLSVAVATTATPATARRDNDVARRPPVQASSTAPTVTGLRRGIHNGTRGRRCPPTRSQPRRRSESDSGLPRRVPWRHCCASPCSSFSSSASRYCRGVARA